MAATASSGQRLDGRHALVCGASDGIGRATAMALATRGAAITALARNESRLKELVPLLLKAGAPVARILVADLDRREALSASIDHWIAEQGPIHILVNNSGGPASGPILDATEEQFLQAFGRHVLASHLLVRKALPGMKAAGFGRIINIISTSVREPIPGLGVSNTIRAAMAGWSKTLAAELPPGVTINNVLPGFTDTARLSELKAAMASRRSLSPSEVEKSWLTTVPEGRLGAPEEIAEAVAFLASPAASFVRGVSLPVDGGRLKSL